MLFSTQEECTAVKPKVTCSAMGSPHLKGDHRGSPNTLFHIHHIYSFHVYWEPIWATRQRVKNWGNRREQAKQGSYCHEANSPMTGIKHTKPLRKISDKSYDDKNMI